MIFWVRIRGREEDRQKSETPYFVTSCHVRHSSPATVIFIGAAGNKLVADVLGDGSPPLLLLHGGGHRPATLGTRAYRPQCEYKATGLGWSPDYEN